MNSSDLFLNWLSHFGFSILILVSTYFGLYFLFVSQKFCDCSYWDKLFGEFRACLTTQKVKISEDTKVVLIIGDKDRNGYLCLSEFAKYYDLLVLTRKRVKKLSEDIMSYIILLVIVSCVYATILLIIGSREQEIKVAETAIYFTPAAFVAISVFFCFVHIFFARMKISSFVTDKSEEELAMENNHGTFCDIKDFMERLKGGES